MLNDFLKTINRFKKLIPSIYTNESTKASVKNVKKPVAKPVTVNKNTQEVKAENTTDSQTTVNTNTGKYGNICVVLDPGHAKTTAGKRSPYSMGKQETPVLPLEEWKFNRDITNKLKTELERHGIDVFVTTDETRDGNTDLALTERAQRANDYVKKSGKSGLFISIHADAQGYGDQWTSANGWSAYTTVGKSKADDFAECLYDAAEKILKPKGITIRTDRSDGDKDKESNFTVIKKTSMPAVLTENLFYTNIENTEFMLSDEGQNDIVQVHLTGILNYAEKYI